MDRQLHEKKFNLIVKRFNEIKEIINDLEILLDDLELFFKNSKEMEIVKINQLIKNIKESNLNYCKDNKEIEKYKQSIIDAKSRLKKKKSLIYLEIYKREKETIINDDYKCLNNAEIKIMNFKPYLTNKIINNIDNELLTIIKSLKLDQEKINNEANILADIYKLEGSKGQNKINNSITCIYYKEKIVKLTSSTIKIIEVSKVKKDSLYTLLNTILQNLEKNEIVNTIQLSIKILKIHYIDIFDENSNFNKLLLKLYSHPEYIEFLLGITVDNYEKIKDKIQDKKLQESFKLIKIFIKLFENKEEIHNMKDKELIKRIKNEIEGSNEKITNTNNGDDLFFEIDDLIKLQN